MTGLRGRTALVTGAAGGLGAAVADGLAAAGTQVVIVDRDADGLAAKRAELSANGHGCESIVGDVTDPDTSRRAVGVAAGVFGGIDVLCNVAGISPPIAVPDTTPALFDEIMHTNCLAQLMAIQSVLPHMIKVGGGSIINVSSVGALVALPRLTAYCASKAAVLGLTRSIAYEYADANIRCNAICPGGIDTPMAAEVVGSFDSREDALARLTGRQLAKRFASPQEIASLVIYLASAESAFVNGAVISIDAGHTTW
jgi:meso-butanediol dehydrogenase/(S,S)-butanediol dehydrogenase/diacetyl reductase